MRFCPRPDAKARALAPVLLTLLLSATPETPASAQVVYCTNCSSELTQLQNYLQLVATLAKQAALLEQAITQTGLMVQNATPLAKPPMETGKRICRRCRTLSPRQTHSPMRPPISTRPSMPASRPIRPMQRRRRPAQASPPNISNGRRTWRRAS